jgi:hypothetical protein
MNPLSDSSLELVDGGDSLISCVYLRSSNSDLYSEMNFAAQTNRRQDALAHDCSIDCIFYNLMEMFFASRNKATALKTPM